MIEAVNTVGAKHQRESQISNEMGALETSVGELTEAITAVESRFSAVLSMPPPAPTDEGGKTASSDLVTLALAIRNSRQIIQSATNRLYSIRDRCEL